MFITHQPMVTLQLHNFDLFRTCRTSSFCTVAWQLARFQLTRCIVQSLGDSWASCTFLVLAHVGSPRKGPLNGCMCVLLLWLVLTFSGSVGLRLGLLLGLELVLGVRMPLLEWQKLAYGFVRYPVCLFVLEVLYMVIWIQSKYKVFCEIEIDFEWRQL